MTATEPVPPKVVLTAAQVEAISEAIGRALEKVRAGGSGLYGIPFELGIPDVKMRMVIQREAVKLQVLPKVVKPARKRLVRP